jgi:hypothetical protein
MKETPSLVAVSEVHWSLGIKANALYRDGPNLRVLPGGQSTRAVAAMAVASGTQASAAVMANEATAPRANGTCMKCGTCGSTTAAPEPTVGRRKKTGEA